MKKYLIFVLFIAVFILNQGVANADLEKYCSMNPQEKKEVDNLLTGNGLEISCLSNIKTYKVDNNIVNINYFMLYIESRVYKKNIPVDQICSMFNHVDSNLQTKLGVQLDCTDTQKPLMYIDGKNINSEIFLIELTIRQDNLSKVERFNYLTNINNGINKESSEIKLEGLNKENLINIDMDNWGKIVNFMNKNDGKINYCLNQDNQFPSFKHIYVGKLSSITGNFNFHVICNPNLQSVSLYSIGDSGKAHTRKEFLEEINLIANNNLLNGTELIKNIKIIDDEKNKLIPDNKSKYLKQKTLSTSALKKAKQERYIAQLDKLIEKTNNKKLTQVFDRIQKLEKRNNVINYLESIIYLKLNK